MSVSDGVRFGIGQQLGRAIVPLVVVVVLMLSSWAIVEVVAWAEGRRRASRASGVRLDNAPRPLPENTPAFFADLWASVRADPRVLSIAYDYSGGPIVVRVRQRRGDARTVPEVVRAAATRYPIEIRWHPDVFNPSEFDELTHEGE